MRIVVTFVADSVINTEHRSLIMLTWTSPDLGSQHHSRFSMVTTPPEVCVATICGRVGKDALTEAVFRVALRWASERWMEYHLRVLSTNPSL